MSTENLYTPNCIRTYTGVYFNLVEPTIDMINIEDIAHSLSMQCRFSGHLKHHYSVAEHCVRVADDLPTIHAFEGLMHDASEAYIIDVARPVKLLLRDYSGIENKIMLLIAQKFGFNWPVAPRVKHIDDEILQWEWQRYMLWQWKGWTQEEAEARFIKKFNQLKN